MVEQMGGRQHPSEEGDAASRATWYRKDDHSQSRGFGPRLVGDRDERIRGEERSSDQEGGHNRFSEHLLSSFGDGKGTQKTLILLDEVDHLSGGFGAQSETRIRESMSSADPTKKISGDRGGKGEVLSLLKNTLQPVLMTCNDDMRLWGRSGWRANRDRMFRLAEYAYFKRVDRASMVRVAQRVLSKEGFEIRMEDLDILLEGKPR